MQFIGADKIFDGEKFLDDGSVLGINNNVVKSIVLKDEIDENLIKKHKGIICPGFVNAHCHLELSHLHNKILQHAGLPRFAKEVVKSRNAFTNHEIIELAEIQDAEMYKNGIVAVGDICNTDITFGIKENSKLYYHSFIELIGLNPINAEIFFNKGLDLLNISKVKGLKASLAPHAPYSTSNKLIALIAGYNKNHNLVTSIHNQESKEEDKFFKGEENTFNELYKFLNIDLSFYKAPNTSSFYSYYGNIKNNKSIFVHNTFTTKEDVLLSENPQHYWCFCPKANLYIENKLPNYTLFKHKKKNICIGTDSLASNNNLNIVEEANTLLNHNNEFSIEEILSMLTLNGAKALGIDTIYGRIKEGTKFLNLIEMSDNKSFNLIKSNIIF